LIPGSIVKAALTPFPSKIVSTKFTNMGQSGGVLEINLDTAYYISGSGTTIVESVQIYNNSALSFLLPDLRGAFLRGTGTNTKYPTFSGVAIGQAQLDVVQPHNHTVTDLGHTHNSLFFNSGATPGNTPNNVGTYNPGASSTTVSQNSATGITVNSEGDSIDVETRPFNYSVYYYIKT
jgi:hypothetical protein